MHTHKTRRNSILLIITALIWGVAFVAQSEGGDAVGPYTFNGIRSLIGGMVLIPVIGILDRAKLTSRRPTNKEEKKTLMIGGICCGTILFVASSLQQFGIYLGTPVGKAGFLTACYIIIVPILGLFFKKTCGWNIWAGVVITVIGLYLLCMKGGLQLQLSDVLIFLCAIVFAMHIMVVDHFSPLVDGVRMSCIQFWVCGILSLVPMMIFEMKPFSGGLLEWRIALASFDAWIPILYAGVMSCGVAYTLQIVGQEDVNPTIASLLMSLESVFSVIAGAVILHEFLTVREMIGCVLIFVAVVLAQIEFAHK